MPRRQPPGTVASNRRARHDYEILDTFEAGIALRGSEVKTLREGRASLQDAYAVVEDGEVILHMQIPAYSHTGYDGHEPTRPRKLLLHRKEIDQLAYDKRQAIAQRDAAREMDRVRKARVRAG